MEKVEISLETYDKLKVDQVFLNRISEGKDDDFIKVDYYYEGDYNIKILSKQEYESRLLSVAKNIRAHNQLLEKALDDCRGELRNVKTDLRGEIAENKRATDTLNKIPRWIKRIFGA